MASRGAPTDLLSLIGPPGTAVVTDLGWFDAFTTRVDRLARKTGVALDAETLLTERAALLGHRGWGPVSAGGSCRMVAAADGWLAVNLPREDDIAAVPALLELESCPSGDVWVVVAQGAATRSRADVIERATLLGLPIAAVGEGGRAGAGVTGPGGPVRPRPQPRVVDLSAMWAGPLCGSILAAAGATVVKVESTTRPDGSRHGAPPFYRHLNGAKEIVDLDFGNPAGRRELARLVADADIVIEASRPRALSALGIDAAAEVARGAIWLSITGYGRVSARVAFGDDAAAAGGLVHLPSGGGPPWFVGDAAADPISGVAAATAGLQHWQDGTGALVDIAMRDRVASLVHGGAAARGIHR